MKRFNKMLMGFVVLLAVAFPVITNAAAWEEDQLSIQYLRAQGNGATYTGASGVGGTTGGTSVSILASNHGFYTDTQITIAGTTNYNGTHTITAVDSDSFTIVHGYTAETFSGATAAVSLKPTTGDGFQFLGFRLRCDTAPSTAEQFSVTVDANPTSYSGGTFDHDIWSSAGSNTANGSMAGVKDIVKTYESTDMFRYVAGDEIDFIWDNTDNREWAIEILYRRRK